MLLLFVMMIGLKLTKFLNLQKEKVKFAFNFFHYETISWVTRVYFYFAVYIVEAFLLKKGVSAFRNLNIQIYVLPLESKCPKLYLTPKT